MKRKRHNPEQIIRKRRSAEQLLNQVHYRSGAQVVDQVRNTSRQVHLGRIHLWNRSTADSGMSF